MGVIKKLLFRTKKFVVNLTLSTTSTSATWSPNSVTNTGAILTWDVTGNIAPTFQTINDPTFDLSANTGTVNMDVYDVSGLTVLRIFSQIITSLNLDNCLELTELICYNNQITNLNLSENTLLTKLSCYSNPLGTLNISNNTELVDLICYANQLSVLNTTVNTKLTSINCFSNLLTGLDTSTNTLLTFLNCGYQSITSLNLTSNTQLINLQCPFCSLSILDLSTNINLTNVTVNGNNMSSTVTDQIYIDLANGIGVNGNLVIRNNRTAASDAARATLVSRGWIFNEASTT